MRKLFLVCFSLFLLQSSGFSAQPFLVRASNDLKKRLPLEDRTEVFTVLNETLLSLPRVCDFYENRGFRLAWSDDKGVLISAIELLKTLQKADREGLDPAAYHLERLSMLGAEITKDAHQGKKLSLTKTVNLDLLLTDAFLTYGAHLLSGRVDPYEIDSEWRGHRRVADLTAVLEKACEQNNVREMLKGLYPKQSYYSRLRIALDRYRALDRDGGWEAIPQGKAIKKGDHDPRVALLQARLAMEGDLKQIPNESEIFNAAIERALIRFQKRHGLDADGALGAGTLAAMNVPVHERVHQLEVNLERCRWLPEELGDPHILVNAANFSLDVIQNGEPALSMKVVVGRQARHTPVFSSSVTTVVFNPTWSVPVKLARQDIMEHIREEPDYLIKHKFKVYTGYDEDALSVDPATVDWSAVDPKTMNYRFRQDPGVTNALGQIKFLLPNEFDVYLHDTPSRELFRKTKRNFSSGCIRIEKPVELAEFLLHINYGWDREKIMKFLKKKNEQFVSLDKSVPVHLMYWTAWMDERGLVQFREDIYGRDRLVDDALHKAPERL